MKNHWVVHMKDGRDLIFDKKAGYVCTLEGTDILAIITELGGETLAIIPPENVLWIERVIEEE